MRKCHGSIGNVVSVKELVGKHGAHLVRYLLLMTHYRRPIDFSDEVLVAAGKGLATFDRLFGASRSACAAGRQKAGQPGIDLRGDVQTDVRRVCARGDGIEDEIPGQRWTTTSTPPARSACCSRWPARSTGRSNARVWRRKNPRHDLGHRRGHANDARAGRIARHVRQADRRHGARRSSKALPINSCSSSSNSAPSARQKKRLCHRRRHSRWIGEVEDHGRRSRGWHRVEERVTR